MRLFLTKFVKLDPDSFYLLDPDPHSENCCIRIRKK